MDNFSFVVLQYNNHGDTINCIDSLLKQLYPEFFIVVVDNCSTTHSFEIVKERYVNQKKIKIIKTDKNLGFSKGNNIGIEFAKRHGAKDIAVINNDTIIKDKNFINKYYAINSKNLYMIGPKIISTVDKKSQNPFMVPSHFIKNKSMAFKLFLVGFIKYILILMGFKEFWEKGNSTRDYTLGLANNELRSSNNDFMLYGAAFILTSNFIKEYDRIPELTFMYEEETIIYIVLNKLNKEYAYIPNLVIYHAEQSSTQTTYSNRRKRLKFGYREDLKSRIKILKLSFKINNKKYLSSLLKNN